MNEKLRRSLLDVARKPAVTKVMSRILPAVDKGVRSLTGGKVTSTAQWLMPTLVLHSTGRKSGQPREHTLTYVRDDAGRPCLVGTNFGGDNHPAWSYNLLANPDAAIEVDGELQKVTAVPLSAEEQAPLWPEFDAVYAGYSSYRERIGGQREIRMFRLDPR